MSKKFNDLRARIDELEEALYRKRDPLEEVFGLSKARTRILSLLISSEVVDTHLVESTLGILGNMRVAVCMMRKDLEPWGLTIHSRRGTGYWIDGVDKARIEAAVATYKELQAAPTAEG
jgi:hypothetical protein